MSDGGDGFSATRLTRMSDLGVRWAGVIRVAEPLTRSGADPWTLYPVNLREGSLPTELPDGQAIYAAMAYGRWQYVGKTAAGIRRRLAGHARDSRAGDSFKADWDALVVLPLDDDVSARYLSTLEKTARELLNPTFGSRWG